MTLEEKKKDVISRIADLEDEQLLENVRKMLEEALPDKPRKPRKAGWGKGIITYVSDDFDDFIPPGFYDNDDDELSN